MILTTPNSEASSSGIRRLFGLIVVEGQIGVVALFNGLSNVAHQSGEGLGPLHQAHGKDQLCVLLILYLDRHVVFGEHVAGTEPELESVSQVDGNGDIGCEASFDGGLDCWLGGQYPCGPSQMHRHRVNVDASDGKT